MPGLLDFQDDPMSQFGGLLMAGTSPFFGVNLGNAVNQYTAIQQQKRKEDRADQQAQLAQLVQSYKILQDQDMQNKRQSYLSGAPYTPNPLLQVHEQKLAQLLGTPMKTAQTANAAIPQAQAQAAPSLPPAQASQYSPVVKPELQASGPMPQPQTPPEQMSLPQLLQGAGITPQMAMVWSGTEKGTEQMMAKLQEAYGPRVVNNVMMQLQPGGNTKFLGGVVSKDTVPVVSGPNGLQAQQIGGLQDILANQAGATEAATQAARAPYTPITVPNSNGSATTMMLNRFMGQPSQGQPATLNVTQPPRMGSGASFGSGVSQTPGDKAQQEDLAKFNAQTFIETQTAGKAAQGGLLKLDRIDQLMRGIDTGKLTPSGMQIAAYAQALGLPVDPKLPNKQAAEALTGQIALELRNPSGGAGMPGALSDNDLKFLRSMTPGLAQTTEGRAMIIETKRKLLQRDQEIAQIARDYRAKNGGKIDDGLMSQIQSYADAHPLFPKGQPGQGWSIQRVD